ncbi:hypothetical protein C0993_004817 [Termitomyces sp. T159_Od127]|nr:hypothetical protein C0993_004817 [Termitomyces sp. T159_Od127]
MRFVRDSGLYPNIPVPKIFALETNFTNPVCAPYVLMELIPGRTLTNSLNKLSRKQQLSYIKSIARLHASLSKPLPFDRIGSIEGGDGQHVVGPLMTLTQECLGGPYKSMEDLWRAQLEQQFLCTPQMFAELFQLLSSLVPHFQPPKSYLPLVLHHPVIAFRNILFDESSISTGALEITGLIDWGGAQILPLLFTSKYPDDLRTIGEDPFQKPGWDYNEDWYTVPCDWTSTGDSSQWPIAYGLGPEPIDYRPSVRGVINKFYLRAYFNVCYAEELRRQHGDADLARATVFKDATYYMKFHEVVCSGWQNWVRHKTWIRETYWRLRNVGHRGKESEELIIGPNMYLESVEEPIRDLGTFGEYPVAIEYEHSTEPPYKNVPKFYHK